LLNKHHQVGNESFPSSLSQKLFIRLDHLYVRYQVLFELKDEERGRKLDA
jgi:hypothetical protein